MSRGGPVGSPLLYRTRKRINPDVSDYQFPPWRRLIFIAGLIAILLLTLAPSVTRGNINVRVFALLPSGIVKHLYSSFTGVQVHVAGLPSSNGWSAIGKNPSTV